MAKIRLSQDLYGIGKSEIDIVQSAPERQPNVATLASSGAPAAISCPSSAAEQDGVAVAKSLRRVSNNFQDLSEIIENIERLRFVGNHRHANFRKCRYEKNERTVQDDDAEDAYVSSNFYENSDDGFSKDFESRGAPNGGGFVMNLKSSRSPSPRVREDESENEEDDELVERGPVRPPMHFNRGKPYFATCNNWYPRQELDAFGQHEISTDYDTSAKEILTDRNYREKIDSCLDKLEDMQPRDFNSVIICDSSFANESIFAVSYFSLFIYWTGTFKVFFKNDKM